VLAQGFELGIFSRHLRCGYAARHL
jgi:hypothetical protein